MTILFVLDFNLLSFSTSGAEEGVDAWRADGIMAKMPPIFPHSVCFTPFLSAPKLHVMEYLIFVLPHRSIHTTTGQFRHLSARRQRPQSFRIIAVLDRCSRLVDARRPFLQTSDLDVKGGDLNRFMIKQLFT